MLVLHTIGKEGAKREEIAATRRRGSDRTSSGWGLNIVGTSLPTNIAGSERRRRGGTRIGGLTPRQLGLQAATVQMREQANGLSARRRPISGRRRAPVHPAMRRRGTAPRRAATISTSHKAPAGDSRQDRTGRVTSLLDRLSRWRGGHVRIASRRYITSSPPDASKNPARLTKNYACRVTRVARRFSARRRCRRGSSPRARASPRARRRTTPRSPVAPEAAACPAPRPRRGRARAPRR